MRVPHPPEAVHFSPVTSLFSFCPCLCSLLFLLLFSSSLSTPSHQRTAWQTLSMFTLPQAEMNNKDAALTVPVCVCNTTSTNLDVQQSHHIFMLIHRQLLQNQLRHVIKK